MAPSAGGAGGRGAGAGGEGGGKEVGGLTFWEQPSYLKLDTGRPPCCGKAGRTKIHATGEGGTPTTTTRPPPILPAHSLPPPPPKVLLLRWQHRLAQEFTSDALLNQAELCILPYSPEIKVIWTIWGLGLASYMHYVASACLLVFSFLIFCGPTASCCLEVLDALSFKNESWGKKRRGLG